MAKEPTGSAKTDKSVEVTKTGPEGQVTDESRDEIATKLVDRFALWAGGAGLIPIPLVDVATVAGVQIQMLRRLSQIYDVPFSDNRGKSVIAGLLGSTIPATSGMGMASVLKMVPLIGTPLGSLMMPALSAGATYAIGKVFIEIAGPEDEIPLKAPAGVGVNWIYRGGRADLMPEDKAGDNAPLIAAVKEANWLPGQVQVFMHGEAQTVMHNLRPYIRKERGVDAKWASSISGWSARRREACWTSAGSTSPSGL